MVKAEVGAWRVQADAEATRRAHDRMPSGSPEQCGCRDCRNFAAARELAYPPEARELFARLGIRTNRESQIGGPIAVSEGSYLYSGWFHFAGTILEGPGPFGAEAGVPAHETGRADRVHPLRYRPLAPRFAILLRSERHLLPAEFGDQPVVQLEFATEVPWRLSEPPEA
jgi:hypothetical protein